MLLLIVLALLLAQGISLWLLSNAHRDALRDSNHRFQLRQLISLVQLLEEIPNELHGDAINAWRRPGLKLGFFDSSPIAPASEYPAISLQTIVEDSLGDQYHNRVRLQMILARDLRNNDLRHHDRRDDDYHDDDDDERDHRYKRPEHFHPHRPPKRPLHELSVAVQLNNGQWFAAKLHVPDLSSRFAYSTLVFVGTAVVLVLLVVFWQLRKITQPLRRLAVAAEALGKGHPVEELEERGPEDIQQTLRAFNQMNERIQRFVSDRTRMLAALSHDLRTPITTMRLRLEMMPDSEVRDKLLESLDEMQQMSEATLTFARESGDGEVSSQVDIGALVGSLCDDLVELGESIEFEEPVARQILLTKPVALKRAIRNLMENAVRYGDKARVYLTSDAESIAIVIQDEGPGIAEEQMELVFEPFVRLEESRSRETGGVGLGLAIARQTIRGFGGEVTLVNRDAGLEVRVELPRQ